MTDITPLIRPDQKIIQSYSQGRFKISGEVFENPVIVTQMSVTEWPNAEPRNPNIDDFVNLDVDVLLIGAGKSTLPLLPQQRAAFRTAGVSVDVMDTGAACRTFNVLTAEGRRVAAALVPIS